MAEAVTRQLAEIVKRLQRPGDSLRWSAPESWHITLQFLGNTTPQQYPCVVDGLRSIAAAPVPVKLEGLGFFDRAGVFFTAVTLTPQLVQLQKKVVAATRPCGFEAEERAYHPHITLARNKGQSNGVHDLKARVGQAPHFTAFTAGEFLLYESFLGPAGSRYEVRERFALRGTAQNAAAPDSPH